MDRFYRVFVKRDIHCTKPAYVIPIRPIFIIYLFFLLLLNITNGQVNVYEADYYNWFDGITGIENSELHQGIVYVEKHRIKGKKTKFFPEPDFVLGSVVFDGQHYFGLDLKYDVFDDELLMKTDRRVGGNVIQLYKTKVDCFKVVGHDFVKINDTKLKSGFYELSLEKATFSLLKKHRKNLREVLGTKLIFHEFEDGKKESLLYYQQNYHSIKKVSDLIELFPLHSTQLKTFLKNQNSNSDFDKQLEELLIHLDGLLEKESEKTNEN